MGIESVPVNKMKLHNDTVGFLKDRYTLAFYNLQDGAELDLTARARGGLKFRKDHAVPLKRPRTQERQAAAAPLDSLKKDGKAGDAPKAGGLPGLPGLPALPGLPGLPGMPGKAGGLPGLPGLPALPGGGGLPKLPGMPGMSMPGLGMGLPGMPKLPNFDPKAGGMPSFPGMPKLPGMP